MTKDWQGDCETVVERVNNDSAGFGASICHNREGIFNGRFLFCERLVRDFSLNELVTHCTFCGTYFAVCCRHESSKARLFPCHNFKLVFVDGACSNNGSVDATAGIRIVMGKGKKDQWSIPIDDTLDPDAKRTSQRAELLAALQGLEKMRMQHFEANTERYRNEKRHESQTFKTHNTRVTAQMEGMRTPQGKGPANLDLYLKLDEAVRSVEKQGIDVGFWKIP
ncbi:hypothetical protein IW261DRAFT_1421499 [Armillaria novae-zelandiae]|uniref:RNase H type-1 domain-containing protein n=1 Tax=Armillaria novae-zelandiae TaxID=153914 RepID=A0AA39TAX1_9AGAR|nr:hypothetical protein IW261DRAFT_1421499 [Armillaria novae-zelandiae]